MRDLYYKIKPVLTDCIFLILFMMLFYIFFTGCTISVTTLHTQGTASDVVDENQAASPEVDAKAEIPSVIPKI